MATKTAATFIILLINLIHQFYYENVNPSLRVSDVSDDKIVSEYDFIIVGAGSAGSVLANRLSEENWDVLLLEAGGDETPVSDTPFLITNLWETDLEWNFTLASQKKSCLHLDGKCRFPAGHVLGGTSVLNGMLYIRGNKYDYDHWASLGNTGWDYNSVLPYFIKSENMTIEKFKKSPFHGTNGYLTVQHSNYNSEIQTAFLKAAKEYGLPERDYNGEIQMGAHPPQMTMRGGSRCSAAKAYLRPVRNRKNLSVVQRALVTKIHIDSNTKTATGVEFMRNGKRRNVYARKEIIVSAGVANSPKLLMLSGIGPKDHLKQLGIKIIKDLPVGKNFHDHIYVPVDIKFDESFKIKGNDFTIEEIAMNYAENRSGFLTNSGLEALAYINTEKDDKNTLPNIQFIMVTRHAMALQNANKQFTILGAVLRPKSRGSVTLRSNDIFDKPVIDMNGFSSSKDFDLTMKGLKELLKIIKHMDGFSFAYPSDDNYPLCSKYSDQTIDDILECIIMYYSYPSFHAVGTSKMGPKYDSDAVVASNLKVHGINRLRIIDASIMPIVVSGATNAPVIMIAEKASDMIKEDHKSSQSYDREEL